SHAKFNAAVIEETPGDVCTAEPANELAVRDTRLRRVEPRSGFSTFWPFDHLCNARNAKNAKSPHSRYAAATRTGTWLERRTLGELSPGNLGTDGTFTIYGNVFMGPCLRTYR